MICLFVECHRIFCSQHSIAHRHERKQEQVPTERYNRHVHLDQIAEWERQAIDKIRKQADEARRPLIAPPTPIILVNEQHYGPLTRLLTISSNFDKQVLTNSFIFRLTLFLFPSRQLSMNMNYYLMKH